MSSRSIGATNYLSNNEVLDREQLEVDPSTCDRLRSYSPVLVEMHNPHATRASNVVARSPGRPMVRI